MAVEPLDFPASWPLGTQSGVYPIPLIKTTIVGFVGRTERGPVDEPVAVTSFADYCRFFGGHCSISSVSYAVQDFFLHGGGKAVVVRVANRATRARIDVPAGSDVLRFEARNPGKQEILRLSIDHERLAADPSRFNLVVQRLRTSGPQLVADQELHPFVSIDGTNDRYLVDVLRDSKLVRLVGPVPGVRPAETAPDRPGDAIKYIGMTQPGTDGEELTDYDIVGSNRDGTGLFAFNRGPRIDLLCLPPPPTRDHGATVFMAAERYCEQARTILIWDPPWTWESSDLALMGARHLGCSSRNVMTYYPRIRPRGERARFKAGLPACGALAGMLAQHDRRGIWQAPAPNDFVLKASFTPVEDLDAARAAVMQRSGINTFVRSTGGTTRLDGNTTVGSSGFASTLWRRLDRRRLSFFILNAIDDAASWAAHHFNPEETMQRLETQVRNFLRSLHEQGALHGRTPEQAFFVQARLRSGCTDRYSLRLGIALDRPQDFAEYEIDVEADRVGQIRHVPALEAAQLFT